MGLRTHSHVSGGIRIILLLHPAFQDACRSALESIHTTFYTLHFPLDSIGGGPEEAAEIMAAAGHEVSAEEAAELFEAAQARLEEGRTLDLDELDAVAGGTRGENGAEPYGPWGGRINWARYGCAATVEPDSSCWGTDGGCDWMNIEYCNFDYSKKCPAWNGPHILDIEGNHRKHCCRCNVEWWVD